jgi:hypothetical protein
MRRARAALRTLTAGAVMIAVAGSSPAASASSAPAGAHAFPRVASAHSASALLNQAFADARAKGSFHQTLSQDAAGVQGSLVDDVTLDSGRQSIVSSDGTRAEVEVIGKTAYMYGNQHALKSYFRFTTNQVDVIGSNWVSVPSTNTAFAAIAYDVTVPTALDEVAPSGHLTEGAKTTVHGQQVIAITGGAPSVFAGGKQGKATIYITASSDPLPVGASIEVVQANNSKLTLTGTMGDWGEHVTVTPPTGQQLSASQVDVLVAELSGFSIPGEPGYFAVDGQHGHPVSVGRPWGESCKPIRFAVERTVPNWVHAQIAAVVAEARKQGIDVTLESRSFKWEHGSLYYRSGQSAATTAQVDIVATGTTPPKTKGKLPMDLTWNSKLDGDKRNEDLTSVTAAFSLPVLDGQTATVRRSIRQLIAWTQGISETTDPVSGITLRSFTDRFTPTDVAAMLAMSGCGKPARNTVTGIAA